MTEPNDQTEATSRGHWVAAICGVIALGIMTCALVLARQDGANEGSGSANAGDTPPVQLSDTEKYGAPRPGANGGGDPAADAGGCGQLDPEHPPAVSFELPDGKLQMGALKQGVKEEREVTFRNSGTGPLCVAKVSTGCGCMKAKLIGEKRRYEPGETGKIQVVIDTTGRVGTIRKQVTMTTNALQTPLKSFRVELKVDGGLIAEPRYLQFASTVPSTPVTRYLILRAPKDDPAWQVTGLESVRDVPGRGFTRYDWEATEVEDPRYRKFKVRVTHPGFRETGPVRDIIRVTTTHPERKTLEVSAHINVLPRIMSRSRVISLGFVRPGTPRPPMRARIQPGMPGIEFEILKVEIQPKDGKEPPVGGLGFTATSGKDDRGWWADVGYDGRARQPGLLEAVLVVHTDDKAQPEVRVPIRATIRPAR